MGLFGRRRDDDDEMDEWAYQLTRKDSFPLAATITGSIIILVVAVLIGIFAGHRHLIAVTFGASTLIALLVWAIAFTITLRRAEIGWQIGSLGAMLVAGLVAAAIGFGTAISAIQDDERAAFEVKINPSFGLELPEGGARGPISKVMFAIFKEMVDAEMKHRQMASALGYDAMRSPGALREHRELLSHCDKRPEATPMIEDYYTRRQVLFDKAASQLEALDLDDSFRDDIREAAAEAGPRFHELQQRLAANEHSQLGELVATCQILAQRRWAEQFGAIAFKSPSDMRAFNAHIRTEHSLTEEAAALTRDNIAMNAYKASMMHHNWFKMLSYQ